MCEDYGRKLAVLCLVTSADAGVWWCRYRSLVIQIHYSELKGVKQRDTMKCMQRYRFQWISSLSNVYINM